MKPQISLSLKLTLIVVIVPAIIIFSMTYINIREQTDFFEKAYEEKATALALALDASISNIEELEEQNKENLFKDIVSFMTLNIQSGIEKISINLPDESNPNTLRTHVSSDVLLIGDLSDSNNIESYNKNSVVRVASHTEGAHTLNVITPLHISGGTVGTYEIELSMDEAYASLGARLINIFMISTISLILLVISFFFLLRATVINPVTKFKETIKKVGEGSLDSEVNIKSHDEIGDLAKAFNNMIKEIKISRAKIEKYSKTLESKVDERTKELEGSKEELRGKVEALEKNKLAMLNILEDLKKTQKEISILNKNLEQKVSERTEELEKVLKYKDEFINQLSHDLKNPLVPITNLLPVLIKKIDDPELVNYVKIIQRRINYIKHLVVQILEFARLNSPLLKLDIENLNLFEITNQVFEDNQLIFKDKDIKIKNMIDENIFLDADKVKLEELISNLSTNAVKYMEKGGTITINAKEDNEFINVSIKDTGIGLTKEELDHVFDEFYKADWSRHDQSSIGLGLSICKRIVDKHNGRIWAESLGNGKGSTFRFSIPKDLKRSIEKK